jgi:hypothetical protein
MVRGLKEKSGKKTKNLGNVRIAHPTILLKIKVRCALRTYNVIVMRNYCLNYLYQKAIARSHHTPILVQIEHCHR